MTNEDISLCSSSFSSSWKMLIFLVLVSYNLSVCLDLVIVLVKLFVYLFLVLVLVPSLVSEKLPNPMGFVISSHNVICSK